MLPLSIEKYIPQRKPFILVDSILEVSDNSIITEFKIEEEHILCQSGELQESGLVENIAQSAAAMEGYNAIKNNQSIKLGMIGAVKRLKIYNKAYVKTKLTTTVNAENEVMGVKIIKGTVRIDNKIIAECSMQIFLKDN